MGIAWPKRLKKGSEVIANQCLEEQLLRVDISVIAADTPSRPSRGWGTSFQIRQHQLIRRDRGGARLAVRVTGGVRLAEIGYRALLQPLGCSGIDQLLQFCNLASGPDQMIVGLRRGGERQQKSTQNYYYQSHSILLEAISRLNNRY